MTIPINLISTIAFVTMFIVQLVKDLPFLAKVPTKLVVIVVSLLVGFGISLSAGTLTVASIFMTVTSSLAGGFVSIYGWDTFYELKDRFKQVKTDEEVK